MEYIKKYWPIAFLILALAFIGYLFPSWRKEVEKNKALTRTISVQDKKIKTKVKEKVIRIPVQIGERIVYRTERITDRDTSENTHSGTDSLVDVTTEKSVETKRGQFRLGFGINPLNTEVGLHLSAVNVIGPLGAWGYSTLTYHAIGADLGF